jgi:ribosome-binding ATPase YchF (GTP1/OBG family)
VGKDEVKAWAIRKNDTAVDAASQIHTDFGKGFINAEVISAEKLIANPTFVDKLEKNMKKEGKAYIVKDGDICHFNCKYK